MDAIYLLTGLCTVTGAVIGLILTCYLERRWLNARRRRPEPPEPVGLEPECLEPDGLST